MKILAAYIAGLLTALSLVAGAATLTITTTGAQDARLGPAFGAKLGLGRNATVAEVKTWVIDQLQAVVRDYEYEQARQAITTQAFDPS